MNLKRRAIDAVSALAAARGYELTPSWHVESQPLATHLSRLFERYAIDCVFDVGGNRGQYHDFLRERVGYRGHIVSFEPVRKYVELLQWRAREDPRWTIVDRALGREPGSAEINVTHSPGLNSFLAPSNDAVDHFWDGETIVKETVQIDRFDDRYPAFRDELGFSAPYLKLDTQGFDLEVIAGARDSMDAIRAMQTEASVQPIYAGMPDWRESIETARRYGFELSGMFPVSHDARLRLVEFDCVMVRA